GPRRVNGEFSWDNGSRLYYANLTGKINGGFPQVEPFPGFLVVGVSRLDNPTPTSVLNKNSWMPPVISSSRTSATSFEDKEQIWADNAESSPFFGHVYVCVDDFRSNSRGNALAQTVSVNISTDGGDTWKVKQISTAASNAARGFQGGCTVRTDSEGTVYVFYTHFAVGTPGLGAHTMQKSFD